MIIYYAYFGITLEKIIYADYSWFWQRKGSVELWKSSMEMQTSWLEPGASNAKDMDLIPVWAIHSRAGLDDPCESLPAHNILRLWFCGSLKSKCFQKMFFCETIQLFGFYSLQVKTCNLKTDSLCFSPFSGCSPVQITLRDSFPTGGSGSVLQRSTFVDGNRFEALPREKITSKYSSVKGTSLLYNCRFLD